MSNINLSIFDFPGYYLAVVECGATIFTNYQLHLPKDYLCVGVLEKKICKRQIC